MSAGEFITTDVFGTFVLLEAAREAPDLRRFIQISTDEVYGSVPEGSSRETDELQAAQPVLGEQGRRRSARLQLLGHLRRAGRSSRARRTTTARTSFPRRSSRCSSRTLIDDMPVPLYGDGLNERDWLHVDDHCRAHRPADRARRRRARSTTSAAATRSQNVDLTHRILELVGKPESLIQPVADRPGHDRRYSLDTAKLDALGWTPQVTLRRRARARPSPGTARTSGGGGRSRTRTRRSSSTTRRSTASRD